MNNELLNLSTLADYSKLVISYDNAIKLKLAGLVPYSWFSYFQSSEQLYPTVEGCKDYLEANGIDIEDRIAAYTANELDIIISAISPSYMFSGANERFAVENLVHLLKSDENLHKANMAIITFHGIDPKNTVFHYLEF